MPRSRKPVYHSEETQFGGGDEEIEQCPICHQEFTGFCPLNSNRCPYVDKAEQDEEDDDEGESDFDDVTHVDDILEDDQEAEKEVDEAGDAPPEALNEDE